MARRSSGGERSARPAPRPSAARSPPPKKAKAQSNSGDSLLGSFGSAIADGIGFGAGHAVANRVVDAVMGPRTIQHETVVSQAAAPSAPTATSMGGSEACNAQSKSFQDCLNGSVDDICRCQFYMDLLVECRKNSGSMMS